jgi:glycosyltransferase involved in cell wall biosynthesis
MDLSSSGLFVSWLHFQRRSQSVAKLYNMPIKYFHYNWEEKHKAFKAFSYILKFIHTFLYLMKKRPEIVIVQLAPTPPLYVVAFYAMLTNAKYISDCHNTMIYDGHWIKWPLAKVLLRRSSMVLVHNPEVKQQALAIGVESFICMDPPPNILVNEQIEKVAGINIKQQKYVLLPCNMAADDEPTEEFFNAAKQLSDIQFVLTGFLEKVPEHKRKLAPSNIQYTGFLEEDEFNALYKNAFLAIVLSTREGTQPSGASEAIALGVPLIVTDLVTTRRLYKNTVVFTQNTSEDLVKAIKEAFDNRSFYKGKIIETKKMIGTQTKEQYDNLKYFISAIKEDTSGKSFTVKQEFNTQ